MKSEIKLIGNKLAKNRSWLDKKLVREIMEQGCSIENVEYLKESKSRLKFDNREYQIKIMLLNSIKGNELFQDITQTVYGTISSLYLPPIDENKEDHDVGSLIDKIEFPVFYVTIVYSALINERSLKKSFSILSTTPYVTVKALTLRDDKDVGDEEFELFVGEGSSNISRYTIHKFNGGTRSDAAKPNVLYPDVNGQTTYTAPVDIAIWPLAGGILVRFFAMDDDYQSGDHRRESGSGQPNIQAYRVSTNSITTSSWPVSVSNTIPVWATQDDIYGQTGVEYVSETNMNTQLRGRSYFDTDEATNGELNDINWNLGLKYY